MEQIVRADAQIEHVARLHAIGIVVVVLLAREVIVAALGQREQLRGDLALPPPALTQSVIGLATVANTPLQAKPIETC